MKNILFDLDGTLTDSGEGIFHCAEITLAHFGLPVPDRSQLRFMVGPPLRESFPQLGIAPQGTNGAKERTPEEFAAAEAKKKAKQRREQANDNDDDDDAA